MLLSNTCVRWLDYHEAWAELRDNNGSFGQIQTWFSEKAMALHSSTLAWKIPWTEEPGRLLSMGSRSGHDWATSLWLFTFMHWRRKWQPTPVFLPRESQEWGKPGGLPSMGSHRAGHDWSDIATANMILEEKLYNCFNVLLRKFSHRGKTFSLGEVNQISSVSKIRYDPCQHISYPKHRIFFQCSSECLYSGLSSECISSLVLVQCSILEDGLGNMHWLIPLSYHF